MEAIKTAVIGIGNMGTAHACTLAKSDRSHVVL